MANNKLECLECNPPRTFRSIPGLKGHMQFKHDKSGTYTERPPSKTNEMIQQLLDQQEHLLNQQDKLVNQQQALYALVAERVDNRIGVFSGGNGNDNPGNNDQGNNNGNPGNNHQGNGNNGNPGNDHQGNDNGNPGDDEQEYYCNDCKSPIFEGQERCPSCKKGLNWNGVAVN